MKYTMKQAIFMSALLDEVRCELANVECEQTDFDRGWFGEDEVMSYLRFLIKQHHDEWTIINDLNLKL